MIQIVTAAFTKPSVTNPVCGNCDSWFRPIEKGGVNGHCLHDRPVRACDVDAPQGETAFEYQGDLRTSKGCCCRLWRRIGTDEDYTGSD